MTNKLKFFLFFLLQLMFLLGMCFLITSCTTEQLRFLLWMSDYYNDKTDTETSLKLTIRISGSNKLVSGALIQVVGRHNGIFRQGKSNNNGIIIFRNLEPGIYDIRAWKGTRSSSDSIYIDGPVSALMYI